MPRSVLKKPVLIVPGRVLARRWRWIWPLWLALLVLAHVASVPGAVAQTCTADVQCRSGLLSNNVCVGDTLVVKRRICVGGRCQEQELRREGCRTSGSIDRCVGNVHERDGGRCDALSGRCVQRLERQVCTKSCSCSGKLLIVATGQCAPGIGCNRAILECANGCTCAPRPMCLDPPAKEK
jgi:hypothetical protein